MIFYYEKLANPDIKLPNNYIIILSYKVIKTTYQDIKMPSPGHTLPYSRHYNYTFFCCKTK